MPGLHASAIEQARDLSIRHAPGQLAHERYRILRDAGIVLCPVVAGYVDDLSGHCHQAHVNRGIVCFENDKE